MLLVLNIQSTVSAQAWNAVSIINRPVVNMCALTFDDGPSALTPRLLDALKEEDVTATFFLLGEQVAQRPEVVRRMITEGHEVANHGYTHADMLTLSKAGQRAEIQRLNDLLSPMGVTPRFFRPPYGSYNRKVSALVDDMGMEVMMWSTDSRDWQRKPDYSNMPNILERVMTPDEMRGIFLFHDTKKRTVRDIHLIILILRTMGCDRFVTVSEYIDTQEAPIMVAALPLEERAIRQESDFFSEEFRHTFTLEDTPETLAPRPRNAVVAPVIAANNPAFVNDTPTNNSRTPHDSATNIVEEKNQTTKAQHTKETTGAGERQLVADEEGYLDSSLNTKNAWEHISHPASPTQIIAPHLFNKEWSGTERKNTRHLNTILAVLARNALSISFRRTRTSDSEETTLDAMKPLAMPFTNPLASPLAKPLASPLAKPLASPLAKPLASPLAMPLASPLAKPLASPLTKPLASPLATNNEKTVTQ